MDALIVLIINVMIFAAVAAIIIWAVRRLTAAFGIPDPWATVIWVGLVLLLLLFALRWFGLPYAASRGVTVR